ncbi:MAG: P-II family nitrogen regulator [Chthonomonadales bacterium]|nr:P-II family nitrogen regulator [Chthonomonadales bacterium]
MKRVECIIRPSKLDEVKIALGEIGVVGMTVTDVRGSGRDRGHRESYRGADYVIDLPTKVKIEMVVRDEDVEEIIETVLVHGRTGEKGDGKIFVMPMEEAIRVRTEESGDDVL